MNREIKFRAWCAGKHGNMTFSKPMMEYDVVLHSGAYASVESGWDIHGTYQTVPIMQFTGLHDKNGKEIYEGDILKDPAHYPNGYQHSLNNQTGVAYYDTELGGWYITNNLTDGKHETPNQQTLQLATAKNYEVIGNIYENKDLLN